MHKTIEPPPFLDSARRIVYRGDLKRTLLWRIINYGVQARTEAFQKLFNCLRGIAEQKYKGMIYIRSCFLCIECSRCRARAVEEMERARRKRVRLFSRSSDLASLYFGDFQYLAKLYTWPRGNGRSSYLNVSPNKFFASNTLMYRPDRDRSCLILYERD